MKAEDALALSKSYTKKTVAGMGAIKGDKGDDGATFIPSVSEEGIINWTNDKGYVNPLPIKIKGEDGATPHIDPDTKTWVINGVDTGILAETTKDYDMLENKPSINGTVLMGDKGIEDIGIKPLTNKEILEIVNKAYG